MDDLSLFEQLVQFKVVGFRSFEQLDLSFNRVVLMFLFWDGLVQSFKHVLQILHLVESISFLPFDGFQAYVLSLEILLLV